MSLEGVVDVWDVIYLKNDPEGRLTHVVERTFEVNIYPEEPFFETLGLVNYPVQFASIDIRALVLTEDTLCL
jgi:hypothetical protein